MKDRNSTVDVIRGFAMLLVVLGHTMSGVVTEYSDCIFFQMIWTLQMPLFFIISGYVTRFSRPLTDGISLLKFIKKRTLSYLLPWLIWTIVVRGLIFGQTNFLLIGHVLSHMDSGYWFLITIWTISIIYGVSDFLSNIWIKSGLKNILSHLLLCGLGMLGLVLVGHFWGFSFLAIKLTVYYLPFYLLGYVYNTIQDWLMAKKSAKTIIEWMVVVSLGLWLAATYRFNFFAGDDDITFVIGRFVTSILGCLAVTGMFSAAYPQDEGFCFVFLKWSGTHSLEIYLTHYLFLCLVPSSCLPSLSSMEGLFSLTINFMLTMALVILTIKLVQSNRTLNFLLYAK